MAEFLNIETVNVIRSEYESTNGGLSSQFDELHVIHEDDEKVIEELKKNPLYNYHLILVKRVLWGENHDYLKPLHDKEGCLSAMYGGNTAVLADGRTLKIHDRYETQKQYDLHT